MATSDLEFWDWCVLRAIRAGAPNPVEIADTALDARRERQRAAEVAARLLPDKFAVTEAELAMAAQPNGFIPAIKAYRSRTNSSLADSKRALERALGR